MRIRCKRSMFRLLRFEIGICLSLLFLSKWYKYRWKHIWNRLAIVHNLCASGSFTSSAFYHSISFSGSRYFFFGGGYLFLWANDFLLGLVMQCMFWKHLFLELLVVIVFFSGMPVCVYSVELSSYNKARISSFDLKVILVFHSMCWS